MGGSGKGENPEQLFAMGYAGKTLITSSSPEGVLMSRYDVCVTRLSPWRPSACSETARKERNGREGCSPYERLYRYT